MPASTDLEALFIRLHFDRHIMARLAVDLRGRGYDIRTTEEAGNDTASGPEFDYAADWTNHDRAVTGLPGVKVLLRVDEATYQPVRDYFKTRGGKAMGKDHPAAWLREHDGGRFFYTELGHDLRSLDTKFGKRHVTEGVRWAAGK